MFLVFILSTTKVFAGYEKLTKKNYEKFKDEKAVVIYGVNWGRQWGCAGLDNAQLENLTFSHIDSQSNNLDGESIVLNTPSKLFVDNIFKPNAIIVNPGEYALTRFDIKIAKSRRDVGHLIAESKNLFKTGKAVAGTFTVNAGEVVYIGEFGLDCANPNEPIPWRYYIEKKDFDHFILGFKEEYKFIADKQVIYRLFQTDTMGLNP